jgi:hypothetical protein
VRGDLVVLFAAIAGTGSGVVAAEGQSNPPFLGITMDDSPMGGVLIVGVTADTGAERAGLERQDVIFAMDGVPLPNLTASPQNPVGQSARDVLIDRITAHAPGDSVALKVMRNGSLRDITAVLSSRTDLMQHHLVGTEVDVPTLDLDTHAALDHLDLEGRTTVVGWLYDDRNAHCSDCMKVLDRIDRRLRKLSPVDGPRVLAITNASEDNARRARDLDSPTLQVLHAEQTDIESTLAIADPRRLAITVSDCHGVAQFVAVVLPGADDEDAVVDEIVAAVEQATHPLRR